MIDQSTNSHRINNKTLILHFFTRSSEANQHIDYPASLKARYSSDR